MHMIETRQNVIVQKKDEIWTVSNNNGLRLNLSISRKSGLSAMKLVTDSCVRHGSFRKHRTLP